VHRPLPFQQVGVFPTSIRCILTGGVGKAHHWRAGRTRLKSSKAWRDQLHTPGQPTTAMQELPLTGAGPARLRWCSKWMESAGRRTRCHRDPARRDSSPCRGHPRRKAASGRLARLVLKELELLRWSPRRALTFPWRVRRERASGERPESAGTARRVVALEGWSRRRSATARRPQGHSPRQRRIFSMTSSCAGEEMAESTSSLEPQSGQSSGWSFQPPPVALFDLHELAPLAFLVDRDEPRVPSPRRRLPESIRISSGSWSRAHRR
jgi:hypothetical protein